MTGLQDVQGAPHVAFAELYESVCGGGGYVDVFFVDYFVYEDADIDLFEGTEPKSRTATQ